MDHGVRDLNPRRPAVRQDSAGLQLQDVDQTPRDRGVRRLHLQRGGQLTFEPRGQGCKGLAVRTAYYEGGRTEDLVPEPLVGREGFRVCSEEGAGALSDALAHAATR